MIKEPKIILNNVFSKEHRKKLIEDCEPLLLGKEQKRSLRPYENHAPLSIP